VQAREVFGVPPKCGNACFFVVSTPVKKYPDEWMPVPCSIVGMPLCVLRLRVAILNINSAMKTLYIW